MSLAPAGAASGAGEAAETADMPIAGRGQPGGAASVEPAAVAAAAAADAADGAPFEAPEPLGIPKAAASRPGAGPRPDTDGEAAAGAFPPGRDREPFRGGASVPRLASGDVRAAHRAHGGRGSEGGRRRATGYGVRDTAGPGRPAGRRRGGCRGRLPCPPPGVARKAQTLSPAGAAPPGTGGGGAPFRRRPRGCGARPRGREQLGPSASGRRRPRHGPARPALAGDAARDAREPRRAPPPRPVRSAMTAVRARASCRAPGKGTGRGSGSPPRVIPLALPPDATPRAGGWRPEPASVIEGGGDFLPRPVAGQGRKPGSRPGEAWKGESARILAHDGAYGPVPAVSANTASIARPNSTKSPSRFVAIEWTISQSSVR